MILKIKHCNNIDDGTISIEEKKLNIKYAMNGAGKSTVARAIELHTKGDGSITELTPFKYRGGRQEDQKPEVTGLDTVSSVAVFNDAYINQFVFKQDEILANSFEVFVKTPDYQKHLSKIEEIISGIKATFLDSEKIDRVIGDLGALTESFGKSKSGYSEAGSLAKGLGKGNKVANVPKNLESFSAYLKSSTNSKWLKWHMEGNSYSVMPDNCPYCTSPTNEKKDVISQISKEYDPKAIEHLNKILTIVENLGTYFSKDASEKLAKITGNVKGLSKEEINYLLQIKQQADTLKTKMLNLKGLTYFSMKDAKKISDYMSDLKIDLSFLSDMDSPTTRDLISGINKSLDEVLEKVGVLQGEIAQQNDVIRKTIEANKNEINDFLKYAGYKYYVEVEYDEENEAYKMRLRHIDSPDSVENGSQHLSYGEKNAFSLVLFMYECLSKNPDVIILDDPISSFDKNKKYAVIDMLFRGKSSLRNKTVLMMTHDLEPVIDVIYNFPDKFASIANAAFIESKNGTIKEIPIKKTDIMTFGKICEENTREGNDVVKLVYLRRHYEIMSNKGNTYQLLSSLLHKKASPTKLESGNETPLTESEVLEATELVKKRMPSFDYGQLLTQISDEVYLKKSFQDAVCNYEKLHLFRVLKGHFPESDVIKKIVNETFHIENEYIMQINPRKYEIVPSFVIAECDKLLSSN